jgi:hypothetical protein
MGLQICSSTDVVPSTSAVLFFLVDGSLVSSSSVLLFSLAMRRHVVLERTRNSVRSVSLASAIVVVEIEQSMMRVPLPAASLTSIQSPIFGIWIVRLPPVIITLEVQRLDGLNDSEKR